MPNKTHLPALFEQGRQQAEALPSMFDNNFDINQIPSSRYNSPTGTSIVPFIDPAIPEVDNEILDQFVTRDNFEKQQSLDKAITRSLQTEDGINLDDKLIAGELAREEGISASSVGRIFKQKNFADDPFTPIDQVIDRKLVEDQTKANIADNLGYTNSKDDFEELYIEPNPEYTESIAGLLREWPVSLAEAAVSPEQPGLPGLALESTAIFAKKVKSFGLVQAGLKQDASLKDVFEFLSFLPTNPEADIDIENAVKIVFSQDSLDGRVARLKQWDNEFVGKYGDKAYYQLGAFMAKEGLVDSAALALALRNPKVAQKLLSDSKTGIWTRMVKALGRASIMGVAGEGVQDSMDAYLGFKTPVSDELGLRIGGAFVGEGVARLLQLAGKGIKNAGNALLGNNIKLTGATGELAAAIDPTVVQSAVDEITQVITPLSPLPTHAAKDSMARVLGDMASETTNTAPYRKIALQSLRALEQNDIGSLGHIFDLTESEIVAGALNPRGSIKTEIMLHGLGNRLIGKKPTKQKQVDEVLNWYFDHGLRTTAKREGELTGDTSFAGWSSLLAEPRNIVGSIADDLADATLTRDSYQGALLKAAQTIFKGTNKKVNQRIFQLRKQFSKQADENPNFYVTSAMLDGHGLTAKQQDQFWAYQKLTDFASLLAENQALQQATKQGVKQLPNGKRVTVIKDGEDFFQDQVLVKELGVKQEPFYAHRSEVGEITQVTGYKKYFTPTRPDDPEFLLGIYNPATGEIGVPFGARHLQDAQEKIGKMETSLKGQPQIAFYWKSGANEKTLNFGVGNNSLSALDSLDLEGQKALKAALMQTGRTDLGDLDMENLRLAFDNVSFGSLFSKQVSGARSKTGLKNVTGGLFDYKPDDEAVIQHLMETSAVGLKDFRNDAIHKFEKEFAEVLDNNLNWDQPIRFLEGKKELAQRAQSVQNFIKNVVFNETDLGRFTRRSLDSWAEKLAKGTPRDKGTLKGILKTELIDTLSKETRDGTALFRHSASALVFAGNVSSFFTQVAPSAAMILGLKGVTNPKHLITGWKDTFGALGVKAGLGSFASKNAKAAARALDKSGIISRADMSDMANVAYGNSNTLFNHAMYFVQKGEEANRANIWLVIRAEMIDKVKQGIMTDINGNLIPEAGLKNFIDSDEFLQITTQKAKQIFLDTTPAGRLKALSGVGATIGHFLAPVIKTHTLIAAKGLSKAEKAGAYAGLFSMFGLAAIPYVGSSLYMMDKVAAKVAGEDDPKDFTIVSDIASNAGKLFLTGLDKLAGFTDEQKKFFKDTTKFGLVKTLSGADINLYHTMSMGLFVQDLIEERADNPLSSIPSAVILTRAAESSANIAEMLYNLHLAQTLDFETAIKQGVELPNQFQAAKDLQTTMGGIANELGNAMPGFGKMVDVLNNHPDTRGYLNPQLNPADTTGVVTRSGKRILPQEQLTERQRLLMLFGLTPEPIQKNRDVRQQEYDRVKILKTMRETWIDRYKNAKTGLAMTQVRRDARTTTDESENMLRATFEGALQRATFSDPSKRYKRGSLWKNWKRAFNKVDQERIAVKQSRSLGEE